jgi:hypothetical protein
MKKILIGLTLLVSMSSFASVEVICGDSSMSNGIAKDYSTKRINDRLIELEKDGKEVEIINFTSNLSEDSRSVGARFQNRECVVVKF